MSMKQRRSAKIMAVTVSGVVLVGLGLWLLPGHAEGQEPIRVSPCYVIAGQGGCRETQCCAKSTTPVTFCEYSGASASGGVINRLNPAKKGSGGVIMEANTMALWCTSWECGPAGGVCGAGACGITGSPKLKKVAQVEVSPDCVMLE